MDLFHLIWKMSPLPKDHFSDSLSCQWESGHNTCSLSRGTNGLVLCCCCCCATLFGGILSPPLVTLKGQKLRPRHFQIHHPIHDAQGEKSTVSTKGIRVGRIYTDLIVGAGWCHIDSASLMIRERLFIT